MAFCSDCGNDKGISRRKTKRNVGVNQIENESLKIKVETSAKEPKFLDRAVSDDHVSLLSEDLKNKGGHVYAHDSSITLLTTTDCLLVDLQNIKVYHMRKCNMVGGNMVMRKRGQVENI